MAGTTKETAKYSCLKPGERVIAFIMPDELVQEYERAWRFDLSCNSRNEYIVKVLKKGIDSHGC